jgi:hypothetical protein
MVPVRLWDVSTNPCGKDAGPCDNGECMVNLSPPYPFVDGKSVIDRPGLTDELRHALAEAERLDGLARESRRLADQWKLAGEHAMLIDGRRRLAESSDLCRDLQVAKLWNFHGLRPPPGVTFDDLLIVR